jgi:hypothetical protein
MRYEHAVGGYCLDRIRVTPKVTELTTSRLAQVLLMTTQQSMRTEFAVVDQLNTEVTVC